MRLDHRRSPTMRPTRSLVFVMALKEQERRRPRLATRAFAARRAPTARSRRQVVRRASRSSRAPRRTPARGSSLIRALTFQSMVQRTSSPGLVRTRTSRKASPSAPLNAGRCTCPMSCSLASLAVKISIVRSAARSSFGITVLQGVAGAPDLLTRASDNPGACVLGRPPGAPPERGAGELRGRDAARESSPGGHAGATLPCRRSRRACAGALGSDWHTLNVRVARRLVQARQRRHRVREPRPSVLGSSSQRALVRLLAQRQLVPDVLGAADPVGRETSSGCVGAGRLRAGPPALRAGRASSRRATCRRRLEALRRSVTLSCARLAAAAARRRSARGHGPARKAVSAYERASRASPGDPGPALRGQGARGRSRVAGPAGQRSARRSSRLAARSAPSRCPRHAHVDLARVRATARLTRRQRRTLAGTEALRTRRPFGGHRVAWARAPRLVLTAASAALRDRGVRDRGPARPCSHLVRPPQPTCRARRLPARSRSGRQPGARAGVDALGAVGVRRGSRCLAQRSPWTPAPSTWGTVAAPGDGQHVAVGLRLSRDDAAAARQLVVRDLESTRGSHGDRPRTSSPSPSDAARVDAGDGDADDDEPLYPCRRVVVDRARMPASSRPLACWFGRVRSWRARRTTLRPSSRRAIRLAMSDPVSVTTRSAEGSEGVVYATTTRLGGRGLGVLRWRKRRLRPW